MIVSTARQEKREGIWPFTGSHVHVDCVRGGTRSNETPTRKSMRKRLGLACSFVLYLVIRRSNTRTTTEYYVLRTILHSTAVVTAIQKDLKSKISFELGPNFLNILL